MNDETANLMLQEVRRMRQLLELLAEPAIAQRDTKLRAELRKIVGSSLKKQQSVLLMDGTRAQKQIVAETQVNAGDLSTMIGKLETAGLLADGKRQPKLAIPILPNFFQTDLSN